MIRFRHISQVLSGEESPRVARGNLTFLCSTIIIIISFIFIILIIIIISIFLIMYVCRYVDEIRGFEQGELGCLHL